MSHQGAVALHVDYQPDNRRSPLNQVSRGAHPRFLKLMVNLYELGRSPVREVATTDMLAPLLLGEGGHRILYTRARKAVASCFVDGNRIALTSAFNNLCGTTAGMLYRPH